ncbi:PREDICTED: ADP-ribosylation factor-binding protein GGA2 isoform X2 [Gekko japonicus]|uniref:ADP-ribosylation factor-binding protein GGA2 isoform X2 n=1 Tax=Gekko japonicus TaxID=146911 RepID=A0ABM1LGY9_GEKJA|nr:PREDICTED: ADP-ribosylation factor-binding protein GGA2 isoform X2 [Gekko japonicus]
MAGAAPPGPLELLLHKATDPSKTDTDWECIQRFCDQVNTDAEGPAVALRLLEHKIQSPQEAEALQALTVLEMCVNNCGENFHSEMGKFRFLNGLIKVLSPKYLGEWSAESVKSRIIQNLFSWTVWFPQEVKIRDAYQMLKKRGIVRQDPKLLEDRIVPPPPRPAGSIFDAEDEKSQMLVRLLQSKDPEDLRAANRLIKGLIKEEQEKTAKVTRRMNAVKEAQSHAEALEERLSRCPARGGGIVAQPEPQELQDLQAKCEKLKPLMFRVASETLEDEAALAEILQANDRLTRALGLYKQVVGTCQNPAAGAVDAPAPQPPPDSAGTPSLIDFSELDSAFGTPGSFQGKAKSKPSSSSSSSTHSLDEELVSLGLPNSPAREAAFSCGLPQVTPPSPSCPANLLANLFIPLESVVLSPIPPVTVYERNGLKALLHFARDPVPGQLAARVMVLSLLSTSPQPTQQVVFQAAVPKSMSIKLQPATGSALQAFNPLLPPAVISQVLLVANPLQAPLRLKYRLLYTQGRQPHCEEGEVTDFPHAELWGGS